MTLALDADVIVRWWMAGAAGHAEARDLVRRHVAAGERLGVVPQVLHEVLHVCTDPRRFAHPLEMQGAVQRARLLWNAPETERVVPGPLALARTLDLMDQHRLGRKRILDTALAAALECEGVRHLATFNGADYRIFPFLTLVSP